MAKKMSSLPEKVLVVAALLSSALVLIVSGAATAQTSPPYYINREYRFAVIFPGEPMAMDIAYTTSSGASAPARRFFRDQGTDRHALTVVDFSAGPPVDAGIVEQAAEEIRRKGAVRFEYAEDYDPGIPGRQLNIFQNDGQQIRASIYMWDHRLFITEASGAPGSFSVLQFEQSVMLLDGNGNELNLDAAAFGGGP